MAFSHWYDWRQKTQNKYLNDIEYPRIVSAPLGRISIVYTIGAYMPFLWSYSIVYHTLYLYMIFFFYGYGYARALLLLVLLLLLLTDDKKKRNISPPGRAFFSVWICG